MTSPSSPATARSSRVWLLVVLGVVVASIAAAVVVVLTRPDDEDRAADAVEAYLRAWGRAEGGDSSACLEVVRHVFDTGYTEIDGVPVNGPLQDCLDEVGSLPGSQVLSFEATGVELVGQTGTVIYTARIRSDEHGQETVTSSIGVVKDDGRWKVG